MEKRSQQQPDGLLVCQKRHRNPENTINERIMCFIST